MKVTYNPDTDTLLLIFSGLPVEESEGEKSGIILDYDKDGGIVAVEVLDASKHVDNPWSIEYAIIERIS